MKTKLINVIICLLISVLSNDVRSETSIKDAIIILQTLTGVQQSSTTKEEESMRPQELPVWDKNKINMEEPDTPHQLNGWSYLGDGKPEAPDMQYFNFWMHNVYSWVKYLNTKAEYTGDLEDDIERLGNTPATLVINSKPVDLTKDLIVPKNINLFWNQGCTLGGAYKLTVENDIMAGDYQLFESETQVLLTSVNVAWTGLDEQNTKEKNTEALQKAFASSSKIILPSGQYSLNSVLFNGNNISIKGKGVLRTSLHIATDLTIPDDLPPELIDDWYQEVAIDSYGLRFTGENITISDFAINPLHTTETVYKTLSLESCKNVRIANIKSTANHNETFIEARESKNIWIDKLNVNEPIHTEPTQVSLRTILCENLYLTNSLVTYPIVYGDHIYFKNNYIRRGIGIAPESSNVHIIDNYLEGVRSNDYGFFINSNNKNAVLNRLTITGNYFKRFERILSCSKVNALTLKDNTYENIQMFWYNNELPHGILDNHYVEVIRKDSFDNSKDVLYIYENTELRFQLTRESSTTIDIEYTNQLLEVQEGGVLDIQIIGTNGSKPSESTHRITFDFDYIHANEVLSGVTSQLDFQIVKVSDNPLLYKLTVSNLPATSSKWQINIKCRRIRSIQN
ncbi:MAG: hypothetical protein OMM_00551 [Candidatus Magnetoglobus multicellularis str. Araruama]|uniref:Pectate lyase superfamily protein domain-containing protein n=1 Tax=Candidatus Magnetoglobus multicellularis str. Araruama TaxID=890399 RepID=A0A1V1PGE3_9BACT|nr:MAG: hypothetical protein OMM_00551 [Candidatus Magnetoglobus multicellularis str. Araruama]